MSVFVPASRLDLLIYRHIRIIHVLKISLALLIAHLINLFYPVPYLAWTSVTIVIIMLTLPQVGGALEKSIQRIIGTLFGAAYGILILYLTRDPVYTGLLAMVAIAFITWRASGKMSYAYLVAGFTMMIVLDGGDQGMSEAIWRTGTILLGCLIAILVSQCVLPLRARNEWRWLLAQSLRGMSHVWHSHLSPNVHKAVQTKARIRALRRTVQRQRGCSTRSVWRPAPCAATSAKWSCWSRCRSGVCCCWSCWRKVAGRTAPARRRCSINMPSAWRRVLRANDCRRLPRFVLVMFRRCRPPKRWMVPSSNKICSAI